MTGASHTALEDDTAAAIVPGSSCLVVSHVDRATVLVDADSYYRAFVQAALAARRYIYITGWQFDTRARLLRPAPGAAPQHPIELLPFLNYLANRFSKKIHPVSMELQQELAGVSTSVEETVTGIRVVKGFGAEHVQSKRMKNTAARVFDRAIYAGKVRAGFMPALDFIPALGILAVVWYGGHQVLDGKLNIGDLAGFLLYVNMLIFPLRMTGQLVETVAVS